MTGATVERVSSGTYEITLPDNWNVAREAYERHMRKLLHVPRPAFTALATDTLRPMWMVA